jgi:uncharacterized membrane protein YedE/YeeE
LKRRFLVFFAFKDRLLVSFDFKARFLVFADFKARLLVLLFAFKASLLVLVAFEERCARHPQFAGGKYDGVLTTTKACVTFPSRDGVQTRLWFLSPVPTRYDREDKLTRN